MDSESLFSVDSGRFELFKSCCAPLAEKLLPIKRNKILIMCLVALSLDPLFCYILVVDDGKNCLRLDKTLTTIAIVLRSIIDFFYILHIMFQLYASRSINPFDILAVLPLPQVLVFAIIPKLNDLRVLKAAKSLNVIFMLQYVLRFLQICSLLKKDLQATGILAKSTLANLLFFMLASHVLGAFWFLLSVERKATCWLEACSHVGIHCSLYCDDTYRGSTILKDYCSKNSTVFDFGIYGDALSSGVVDSADILQRISYCFWWGLQNLSFELYMQLSRSKPQNKYLRLGDLLFSFRFYFWLVIICFSDWKCAGLLAVREVARAEERRVTAEKMRSTKQELESLFRFRSLPQIVKEKIFETVESKVQENILVDGFNFLDHLPMDLRKDAIRHFGWFSLRRVPAFEEWDTHLIEIMCDSLEPACYTEETNIHAEKGTVNAMIFIVRGRLLRLTTNGEELREGDFCGEELILWAFSSSTLPISVTTIKPLCKVLVFILKAEDLKKVSSQYLQLHGIHHIRHILRHYSHEWRIWAASFIQAAWRHHCRQKLEKALREEENRRLQDALANAATDSSLSLGATIYASRFAVNALRTTRKAMMTERILPKLKKPGTS